MLQSSIFPNRTLFDCQSVRVRRKLWGSMDLTSDSSVHPQPLHNALALQVLEAYKGDQQCKYQKNGSADIQRQQGEAERRKASGHHTADPHAHSQGADQVG